MRQRSDITVAIAPSHAAGYPWVNAFARAISQSGFKVIDYGYELQFPQSAHVLIMHWGADIFFIEQTERKLNSLSELLNVWLSAKANRGLRLVWVMHNVRPHDTLPGRSNLAKRFLESLDGIIYLSKCSREKFIETYGTKVRHELVCKRGHDRDDQLSPHRPPPPICEGVKLGYFGRIRPYKGLQDLIGCMDKLDTSDVSLSIAGLRQDTAYAAKIETMAAARSTIHLDLRDELLPLSELEAFTDRCHGFVLPYRNILNSGAVFFALSRNRSVLCPGMGSLLELQADVGVEWLHLYQGALQPSALRSFVQYLRVTEPRTCDLAAHDWAPIARSISQFLDQVCIAGE